MTLEKKSLMSRLVVAIVGLAVFASRRHGAKK
jgi:hypothetical protein